MNGWMLEELLILERVAERPGDRLRAEVLAYLAERSRPAWPRRALGLGLVWLGTLIAGSGPDGLAAPIGRDAGRDAGRDGVAECRAT